MPLWRRPGAIDQLKAEGLVVTRQGSGAFVRRPRRHVRHGSTRHLTDARPEGAGPLAAEATSQGSQSRQDIREVRQLPAPADIAQQLGITEDSPIIHRSHLLWIDDAPSQLADSYFPMDLVRDSSLMQPEPIPGGVHAYLQQELGIALDHADELLVARMPTPQETTTLHLAPGTPVVDLRRTIYNTTGDAVEVTQFVLAGDRHVFAYTVPMGQPSDA